MSGALRTRRNVKQSLVTAKLPSSAPYGVVDEGKLWLNGAQNKQSKKDEELNSSLTHPALQSHFAQQD